MARRRGHDTAPAQGIHRRRRRDDLGLPAPPPGGYKAQPKPGHVPNYPKSAPGELENYEDPLAKLTDAEVCVECAEMTGAQGDFLTDVALAFRLAMHWRKQGFDFRLSWDWTAYQARLGGGSVYIPEDQREGSWFASFSKFDGDGDERKFLFFSCGDCPENRTRWTRAIAIAAIRLWRATKGQTV